MKAADAWHAATDWVNLHVRDQDGFVGAYLTGSTAGKPREAALPLGSDVDVAVVSSGSIPSLKVGKVLHLGVLLDVTHFPRSMFTSTEEILAQYHLAAGLRTNNILIDETGDLHKIQEQVALGFAERRWVSLRCQDAYRKAENSLRGIEAAGPWYDQVTTWLFGTGIMTHVLLVAALRNPTVRLRYLAARELLAEYDNASLYENLLRLLGCADLSAKKIASHHQALGRIFDQAESVSRTPFFFSSDITKVARPIAIDSMAEMIHRGNHREAVFWMVATFARCRKIIDTDGVERTRAEHGPALDEMLEDLGISSVDDMLKRADQALRFMPTLLNAAETLMDRCPEIFS